MIALQVVERPTPLQVDRQPRASRRLRSELGFLHVRIRADFVRRIAGNYLT